MKLLWINLLILINISVLAGSERGKPVLTLWYRQPAKEWMQSTPVGNGRLGAMIFGGINNDRIALNEITMWSGQPDPDQELPCGKEKLAEIRKLFFNGKTEEVNEAAASGIAKMLIQSHEDYIEFLPALPAEWKTGYYKGLCVRDNAMVSADWTDMKIKKASLKAGINNSYKIKIPDPEKMKLSKNRQVCKADLSDGDILKIELEKNDILDIEY